MYDNMVAIAQYSMATSRVSSTVWQFPEQLICRTSFCDSFCK